jgi:hypothetical protein
VVFLRFLRIGTRMELVVDIGMRPANWRVSLTGLVQAEQPV